MLIVNYIKNQYRAINYTCQHKKAYLRVEKQLLGKNTTAGYLHDCNKIILYALLIPEKVAHKIHRAFSPHHVKHNRVRNPIAAVIDWECGSFTKIDFPLNAREFYQTHYPDALGIKEVLERFKL